ncbi:cysteine-rich protective antigen, putative [Plasmodium relictum]|uniref:Cysteine-rich protective antigen, putative n=1 Tax=Plasmodium relictum TaxID=85471 RepID=A0A1J1GJW4_PLARL|nr:cysteine-rich protective antigen, putative [Plasmodium relictum]CRG83975.1 cysteine-rich protective antigen, putative [Plasmodium relictum]
MFLLKKFSFFYFIFLLYKFIKGHHISLVNDEYYVVNSPIFCIRESFMYFRNEVYRVCVNSNEDEDFNIHIYVQKRKGNSWEIEDELLKGKKKKSFISFFSYVYDEEIIIILCDFEGYGKNKKINCFRSHSSTGVDFTTENINVPHDIFNNKDLSYYSSFPYEFNGEKYLLICGIINYIFKSYEGDFIGCAASSDKGSTWNTKFHFRYDGTKHFTSYFLLKVKIFNNKLAFFFHYASTSEESGKYIECSNKSNNDFYCEDVHFDKEKSLRSVIKLNDYFITSFVNKNDRKACYLYYTNENSFLIKPKNTGDELSGCYRASFIKIHDNKIMFVHLSGYGVYNIYTFRYLNYK